MLTVRKVTVQTHNYYKPTRHPVPAPHPRPPPAGQLQTRGQFGGHKEGSRSSPSTSISRAGVPLEPLSTLSLGAPIQGMLLSPTCSGMNSTQPRSPQVCIRGAKCTPETHTDRQRWGWECGGTDWSDLGRGRAP